MRVHHLNCATLHPQSRRFVNGDGSIFERGTMVCHCLLLETDTSLVLVDSGLGTTDVSAPRQSLGRRFVTMSRPAASPEETALAQVKKLGYDPADVRHIVLTHMDLDHAGGLPDFPWARVHLHERELAAVRNPAHKERWRYRQHHWRHQPQWATYRESGEPWFGFDAVRQLDGLPPEVLLVPVHGHTRGHTAVAVQATSNRWLLHAGDAFFHDGDTNPDRSGGPPLLNLFQHHMAVDNPQRLRNRQRLRRLRHDHGDQIEVFAAHDPNAFERYTTIAR